MPNNAPYADTKFSESLQVFFLIGSVHVTGKASRSEAHKQRSCGCCIALKTAFPHAAKTRVASKAL
jgi:hypothetical protein